MRSVGSRAPQALPRVYPATPSTRSPNTRGLVPVLETSHHISGPPGWRDSHLCPGSWTKSPSPMRGSSARAPLTCAPAPRPRASLLRPGCRLPAGCAPGRLTPRSVCALQAGGKVRDLRAEPGEEAAGMRMQDPREAPRPSPRCRKEAPVLGSHPSLRNCPELTESVYDFLGSEFLTKLLGDARH